MNSKEPKYWLMETRRHLELAKIAASKKGLEQIERAEECLEQYVKEKK